MERPIGDRLSMKSIALHLLDSKPIACLALAPREVELPGLWSDLSLNGKRVPAQAAEVEEPTKRATKRRRQSAGRSVGARMV